MWQELIVGALVLLALAFVGHRLFYRKSCGCAGCDGCDGKKPNLTSPSDLARKPGSLCNSGGSGKPGPCGCGR